MKKLVTAVAFVGLGLTIPITAQAEEVAAYHSNGQIVFEPNTEPTDPISPTDPDPENPIKPVDPTTPDGKPEPGTNGPLSIDFASSLYFGTQKSLQKRRSTMLHCKNMWMQQVRSKKDRILCKSQTTGERKVAGHCMSNKMVSLKRQKTKN